MRLTDSRISSPLASLVPLALLALVACGGDGPGVSPNQNVSVADVQLSPTSVTLTPGASATFTATVVSTTGQPITNRPVTWNVANGSIASISQDGRVTGVAVGETSVSATAGGVSATGSVTVQQGATGGNAIAIDVAPSTTFQRISGWEATTEIGESECNRTAFGIYQGQVIDRLANELGINRARISARSGFENTTDYFAELEAGRITQATFNQYRFVAVNDNADPNTINPAGFKWSFLDRKLDAVIVPLRQALAARGEKLFITLTYVDFKSTINQFEQMSNPQEYAELIVATFDHMQQKYGFVPDALELLLEPENTLWDGPTIGRAAVAAAARLRARGYTPQIIGPSTTGMPAASTYWDAMRTVAGVSNVVTELVYHRYSGVSSAALQAIAQRRARDGVTTSMLEHIGSDLDDLMDDLTVAHVSAWQQFAMAYCGANDSGGSYYRIDQSNPNAPQLIMSSTARHLRQLFMYVREGAVRIGATSPSTFLARPVAFRNANGKVVVVVRTSSAQNLQLRGLPAGTYGVNYASGNTTNIDAANVTVGSAGTATVSMPGAGAITIYGK